MFQNNKQAKEFIYTKAALQRILEAKLWIKGRDEN